MTGGPRAPTTAVLLDLDDTLYPQSSWLDGAWARVATTAASLGVVDADVLEQSLVRIAAGGSARGRIIDRALAAVGVDPETPHLAALVQSFRSHEPDTLPAFPGVHEGLGRLAERVSVALVTDGDPAVQAAKFAALDLSGHFTAIVMSDHLGRAFRKPHPRPYEVALTALGSCPDATVFVGDRPETDIVGAHALGIRTIRVRTGEYRECGDVVPADADVADIAAALDLLIAGW